MVELVLSNRTTPKVASGTGTSLGSVFSANLGFRPTRVMIYFYSIPNADMKGAFIDTKQGINAFTVNGNGNRLTITDNGFEVYVYAGYGRANFYYLAVKD